MKTLLRRLLFVFLGLVVLVAIFYAEEDWRGKRAWEKCKAELEAKGEMLDWNAYIPPPVPDDQNFFKAPKMEEWFQRDAPKITQTPMIFSQNTNELWGLSTNGLTTAVIINANGGGKLFEMERPVRTGLRFDSRCIKTPLRADGR